MSLQLPNGLKARDYQESAITQVRSALIKHKREVLCLPTGAGKTFIFSAITWLADQKEKKTLILVDRIELLKQSLSSLRLFGLDPDHFSQGHYPAQTARQYVGMVETVAKRDLSWIQPDLVIIDEAHMGNFKKVFAMFPDARFIGVTATPIYSGKKHHMRDDYDGIVVPVQVPELIDQGHLAKPNYFVNEFTASLVKSSRTNEFTAESLMVVFDNQSSIYKVADDYRNLAFNKKTVIYAVSIRHAQMIAKLLNSLKIKTEIVHSKIPESERTRRLKWLEETPNAVVVNVDVLTKGFDCPDLECIILARATASFTLYLQIIGRGARAPKGKTEFTVIDHGGNVHRHDKWDTTIDWYTEFHFPEYRLSEGESPMKPCPCEKLYCHISAKLCPQCGKAFPAPKKEAVQGETVLLDKPIMPRHLRGRRWQDMSVEQLCEYIQYARTKKTNKPYSKGWVMNQLIARGSEENELALAAELLGMGQSFLDRYLTQLNEK